MFTAVTSQTISILLIVGILIDSNLGDVPIVLTNKPDSQVASGDFNGDGVGDVVVCSWATNTVQIYLGNQDGLTMTYTPSTTKTTKTPRGISAFDLNDDGFDDIIVCSKKTSDITIFYATQTSEVISDGIVINSHGSAGTCHYTTTFDVNNDGHLDVIYIRQHVGEIFALINPGYTVSLSYDWTRYQLGTVEKGTHQIAITNSLSDKGETVMDMVVCMDDLPARWLRFHLPVNADQDETALQRIFGGDKDIDSRAAVWVDLTDNGMEDLVICYKHTNIDACVIYAREDSDTLSKDVVRELKLNTGSDEKPMSVATRTRHFSKENISDLIIVYEKANQVVLWKNINNDFTFDKQIQFTIKSPWTVAVAENKFDDIENDWIFVSNWKGEDVVAYRLE